ncbi:MAG: hypothetical protein B7733_02075 [Myxococcales bacterium FL481]|nr:MAG: hypothetical protein B7733_02075 [Myxococcales bacterium FL481]
MPTAWRYCSSCKTPIPHRATYWTCSVSTCNRARAPMVFCSMDCWDAHLPIARHREAWAEEQTAPGENEAAASSKPAAKPGRVPAEGVRAVRSRDSPGHEPRQGVRRRVETKRQRDPSLPADVLIVASKLKAYVRAASDLNTSANVMDVLSDKVRDLCDAAIERARADGRQTLMDRDFR